MKFCLPTNKQTSKFSCLAPWEIQNFYVFEISWRSPKNLNFLVRSSTFYGQIIGPPTDSDGKGP
jgi:hypothetical protein